MELKVKKLNPNASLPYYATDGAAGLDISACLTEPLELAPNARFAVPTGLALVVPEGHVGLIFNRSSVGLKMGITFPNSVGVIDSDYRGELKIAVQNLSGEMRVITHGMRIAQLVIAPIPRMKVLEVDDLGEKTARGNGGFGSTGTHYSKSS